MSVTYGFFNSVNGDRLYNADQMSLYFEGLISQGVFENVGDRMQVTAGTGMSVNVGTGRAIVQSKWAKNDAALNLAITAADVQKNRIDAIAIRFDATARTVSIVVKEGTATTGAASPPARATGADVYELFLAYVSVPKATSAITQAMITDLRASTNCGWVTGIIDQVDTSDLFDQWQAAYEDYYASATSAFDAYFEAKQLQFEAWFASLTQQLRVDTTLHKYFNYKYLASGVTETTIGINDFDSANDILFVFLNGVTLTEGIDYTISGTGSSSKIILTHALVNANKIEFVVIKSVIGEGMSVTFLKSIKSVGNSIIPTDIVPSYDWIASVDLLFGASLSSTEHTSGYVLGCMNIIETVGVGYYGFFVDRDQWILYFTQGNNWDYAPAINFYERDATTKNTVYMRRGSAYTTYASESVLNDTVADATNLASTPISVCGVTEKVDGTDELWPNSSRELTIYGVKFYSSSGTLLHNLVPAQSNATGRGGLYDLITNKFYPSSSDFDDVIKEAITT